MFDGGTLRGHGSGTTNGGETSLTKGVCTCKLRGGRILVVLLGARLIGGATTRQRDQSAYHASRQISFFILERRGISRFYGRRATNDIRGRYGGTRYRGSGDIPFGRVLVVRLQDGYRARRCYSGVYGEVLHDLEGEVGRATLAGGIARRRRTCGHDELQDGRAYGGHCGSQRRGLYGLYGLAKVVFRSSGTFLFHYTGLGGQQLGSERRHRVQVYHRRGQTWVDQVGRLDRVS